MHKIIVNVSDELWDRLQIHAKHQNNTVASFVRATVTNSLDWKDKRSGKQKKDKNGEGKSELETIMDDLNKKRIPTMGMNVDTVQVVPFPTACVSIKEAKLLALLSSEILVEQAIILPGWTDLHKTLLDCNFIGEVKKQDGTVWYRQRRKWVTKDKHELYDCCKSREKGKDRLW